MDYELNERQWEPGWGEPEEPAAGFVEVPAVPLPEPDHEPPPGPGPTPAIVTPPSEPIPELPPEIDVDPPWLALQGFCVDETREVTVTNRGEGRLTVTSVAVVGEGWTLAPVATPFVLDPGSHTMFALTSTGGEAVLEVRSDDPDEPLLMVPLTGVPNRPPTARISEPADGVVVAEGGGLRLTGEVEDPEDPPERLAAAWSASADGPLGAVTPEPDGGVALDWAAAARAVGTQEVTLTVTDSCGATALDTAALCQDASYTYDALDLTGWHYEGMAYYDSSDAWLVLTDAEEYQVGTAFETSSPVDAGAVTLDFAFYIGGGTGADGISVTALDTDRMSTFLGGDGCGIGYGGDAACTDGPALPGWSIEVDTWYNRGHDPTSRDHLAVTVDGDVDGPEFLVELPEMEDNGWHTMTVAVAAPHMTVSIDGVVYLDEDVPGVGSFPAYVGFTAGTGGATNWHVIDALQVTEHVCGEE